MADNLNAGCNNKIDVNKICAQCAKLCNIKAKHEWVETLVSNDICSQKAEIKNLEVEVGNINQLCAQDISVNKLCANELDIKSLKQCTVDRAYVGFSADFLYTLDEDIDFDASLDNPSNIASFMPTKFTVSKAGYWEFNAFVNADDLSGSVIIAGIPIAKLTVYVNGISRQSIQVPFLSFATGVKVALTCDLLLAAGDEITLKLSVLVQSASSGLINYVGTMSIKGGALALTADPSTMSIILKSELCQNGDDSKTCVIFNVSSFPAITSLVSTAINSLKAPSSDPISAAQAVAEIAAVNLAIGANVEASLGGIGTPAQAAIAAANSILPASLADYVNAATMAGNAIGPVLSAAQIANLTNAIATLNPALSPAVVSAVASSQVQACFKGGSTGCRTCEPVKNQCTPVSILNCEPCDIINPCRDM